MHKNNRRCEFKFESSTYANMFLSTQFRIQNKLTVYQIWFLWILKF